MSDQWGQNGGRPEFAPPELPRPALPSPYSPPAPAEPPSGEPVRPRLTVKTGVALVAGLVAILLVSGAVTVWATSARPQSAMPAAWTAEPSNAPTGGLHPTLPVATGNRATAPGSTPARSTTATPTVTTKAAASAKTSATAPATRTTLRTCEAGQTIVTTAWTAKIPQGWSCPANATADGTTQLLLVDPRDDMIVVSVVADKDAATACTFGMAGQEYGVTPGPDSSWGGKSAKTATLTYMGA